MNSFRKAAYDWGFEDGSRDAPFMPEGLTSDEERMLRLFREDYRQGYLAGQALNS